MNKRSVAQLGILRHRAGLAIFIIIGAVAEVPKIIVEPCLCNVECLLTPHIIVYHKQVALDNRKGGCCKDRDKDNQSQGGGQNKAITMPGM